MLFQAAENGGRAGSKITWMRAAFNARFQILKLAKMSKNLKDMIRSARWFALASPLALISYGQEAVAQRRVVVGLRNIEQQLRFGHRERKVGVFPSG